MNTAHRFWMFDVARPDVLWMTASTLEWAHIKIQMFAKPGQVIRIDVMNQEGDDANKSATTLDK